MIRTPKWVFWRELNGGNDHGMTAERRTTGFALHVPHPDLSEASGDQQIARRGQTETGYPTPDMRLFVGPNALSGRNRKLW